MKRLHRGRRIAVAVVVAGVLLFLLLDQLGFRALSGTDFPARDALSPALRAHVETLASPLWGGRVPGTRGNSDAGHYLAGALAAAGVPPLASAGGNYLVSIGRPGDNVIGYLPADGGANTSVILLGAHFDHLGATHDGVLLGADDNASSVAVLLGALPAIVAQRPRLHPVMVVFFNSEEAPYFGKRDQGSEALLFAPPRELTGTGEARLDVSSIRVALILDLIGGVVWRRSADTVFACGAEKATGLAEIVDGVHEEGLDVRRFGIHMVERLPGYPLMPVSDYNAFRARHVPFLFLSSGRTPRYHTARDLPDTLHYDRMARTSRWIARFVADVDASPAAVAFDDGGADFGRDRDTLLWALDGAAAPWSAVPGTGPATAVRLLQDRARLRAMRDAGHVFGTPDVEALERGSFRLQCLLYSLPACFTL